MSRTAKPANAARPMVCPNAAEHTPRPDGFLAWHAWAERMSRTHRQTRCKGCDLYKIWVPRASSDPGASDAGEPLP